MYGHWTVVKNAKLREAVRQVCADSKIKFDDGDFNEDYFYFRVGGSAGQAPHGSWNNNKDWIQVSIEEFINKIETFEHPLQIGDYLVFFDQSGEFVTANNQKITYEEVKLIITHMKEQK